MRRHSPASMFWPPLLCRPAAFAQVATQANEGYKTHEGRENVAKGLGDPAREERQRPRDIVDALDLKPGGTVADVGTGMGFMLPYLSHAVGDTGHVIGEDIQTDFLDKAKMKVRLSRLEQRAVRAGNRSRSEAAGRYAGGGAGAGRVSSFRLSGSDAGTYSR